MTNWIDALSQAAQTDAFFYFIAGLQNHRQFQ